MLRRAASRPGRRCSSSASAVGVSSAALALARHMGANVVATSRSEAKRARGDRDGRASRRTTRRTQVAGAGRRRDRERRPGDVGAVGPVAQARRPAGRLRRDQRPKVELNLPRLFFKQYEIIGSTMGSYEEFAEVTRLIDDGVAVTSTRRTPLAQYDKALDRLANGEQLGKIVLTH